MPPPPSDHENVKQNQAVLPKEKLVFASIRGSPWISIFRAFGTPHTVDL